MLALYGRVHSLTENLPPHAIEDLLAELPEEYKYSLVLIAYNSYHTISSYADGENRRC